jgi:major royal jelly protein
LVNAQQLKMKKILLLVVILIVTFVAVAWIRYGGGDPYPNLSSSPILNSNVIEEVLAYPEPIGDVAMSLDGRLFFTVHPESRPQGNRLLEYVDGASVPYPDISSQLTLFDTVLGVVVDGFNRLWTIDHGNHGLRTPRLLAFDLESGDLIHDERFPESIAPPGSLLSDLQVSADGRTVIITDASYWRKSPALVVYDIGSGSMRRVLEGDKSVTAESYLIRSQDREMSFLGGIVSLRGGVDGIALGNTWLYFGAISGSGLYRVRLSDLLDESLPEPQLAHRVERYATKPLSNGLSLDVHGNVYVTDIEHNAVYVVGPDHEAKTMIQSEQIRWPEALSFGPDGWLYVSDSALSELVLMPREHIKANQPYRIFRFQPGVGGGPCQ